LQKAVEVKKQTFFLRKPDTLSILYRLEDKKEDKQRLTVTMLAGFRLEPEPVLLDEGSFWQPVKELEAGPFDLGLPKPAGEFFVAGSCYPPDDHAALACPVHVKVGSAEKNLVIFGDRWWTKTGKMTFPVPFKQIKLDWNRSFGGKVGSDNPAGIGMVPTRCPDGKMRKPLPNIQHSDRLHYSASQQPSPVGLGPEGLDWPSRRALVGTLDKNWLAHTWPNPPLDASADLLLLSQPDQRIPNFFRGDEQVILRNLHPLRSQIRSQLPHRRCRCFLCSRSAPDAQQMLEMQCRLDTLWLFPEHETGILIWRAQLNELPEWQTTDYYLAATLEPLAEPPTEATSCCRAILGLPAAEAAEEQPEATAAIDTAQQAPAAEPLAEAQDAAPNVDPLAAAIAEKTAAAKAKLTPLLAAFGISADELLGQVPKTEKNAKILTPAHLEQRSAELHKKLESSLLGTGLAPEDLHPAAKPRTAGTNRGANIATAIAAMKCYGIEDEALFAEMRALEQQAKQSPATKQQHVRPEKPGSNLPLTAVMTREEVLAAYAKGDSLAGLDLSGLDLSGLRLERADFRNAVLDGVNFSGTSLRGADFSGALLTRADCSGAYLAESSFRNCVATGIIAARADFSKADVRKARFDKGNFRQALLSEVQGDHAQFSACILRDADFAKANLQKACFKGADLTAACCADADLRRADFNRTLLDRADFRSSNLEEAWFAEAEGDDVIFCKAKLRRSKCNSTSLPGADFSEADMGQAAWSESVFTEASLRQGMLDRAMLVQCDFRRADFSRASLRQANLMRSDLRQTSLHRANGFKARFRHVRLEESNCCNANFYGADLYKAALRHTLLDGTNLDATLFAISVPT
jgi:uncharacterized protein YjbI with pentapeptide repeats